MTNWCRNMCTRRSRPVPHSTVRWLRYFSRDKYVQGELQQQMLTLRARAPHPNVHLAQVKMGKSISKRRANISWATSQIRSGWTDSSPGYLLYMQDLCFWDQLFPEGTATLKRSIRRIKEIYSLERNSLWNHHRSHWFSSSWSTSACGIGIFILDVSTASSNTHFSFKGVLEQSKTNTPNNLQKTSLSACCATEWVRQCCIQMAQGEV